MRLTIIELSGGGHRLTYVRQMLGALLAPGALPEPPTITLALSEGAIALDAYQHQIVPWLDRARVHPVHLPKGAGRMAQASAGVNAITAIVRDTAPDRVLIPTADGLAQMLGRSPAALRRVERTDLVMHRGSFAYPSPTLKLAVARRAGLWMLGRAKPAHIHFVDVLASEWLHARGAKLASRAGVLPDPIDPDQPRDRTGARERLGLDPSAPLITSAGVQDARKGVPQLLRAFAAGAALFPTARLLLAGRLAPEAQASLDALDPSARERVVVMNRYLSDDELADAISAADLVASCQPRHVGLSNVALRAASLERPVLGSEFGWFGRVIPSFGLGWSGPIDDAPRYARTIAHAFDAATSWAPTEATRRLLAFHSPENFRNTVASWYGGTAPVIGWAETVSHAAPPATRDPNAPATTPSSG